MTTPALTDCNMWGMTTGSIEAHRDVVELQKYLAILGYTFFLRGVGGGGERLAEI